MKKSSIFIITSYVLFFGIILFILRSEPSNEQLDKDISELRSLVESSDNDAAQYNGGLIQTQIQLRKSVLETTEAMLIQKRKSLLRKIKLQYTIESQDNFPASAEKLEEIQKDIQDIENKIKKVQDEADRYRGGLLQATLLINIETQKITLAALQHKYYTAKYGIPFVSVGVDDSEVKKAPVGGIVEDKDAL